MFMVEVSGFRLETHNSALKTITGKRARSSVG